MLPIEMFVFGMLLEGFLVVYVGLGLLKIKAKPRELMLVTMIYTSIAYIVRSEYIMKFLKFGLHSIILVIMLSLIIKLVVKINFRTSIAAALFSFVLLFAGDAALLSPIMMFTGISLEQITENTWRWILFSWISNGFLIVSAILIVKNGFYLIAVPDADAEAKSVEAKQ